MRNTLSILPGLLLACFIALAAQTVESVLPVHLIGSSVLALFIGMTVNRVFSPGERFSAGLAFTSKRVLKLAIILLGASLSISTILYAGRLSLTVMLFTLATCFGGGWIIGKRLGLAWKLSSLISTGTGICGASAIAALAPVIEADEADISYALSATFIFDMVMILLFPVMGSMLGLSDTAYGLWAGTAVNDTSSVVAAGYAFSDAAGDVAAMVKLTRTLAIIPTVLVFSLIAVHTERKARGVDGVRRKPIGIGSLVPWFILFFLLAALINSTGLIPPRISLLTKEISGFLMVAALAAIGLRTDVRSMLRAGFNPMFHGFLISALVVLVSIGVISAMGTG